MAEGEAASSRAPAFVGVGCFMTVVGFFIGAMIGVLVGKFVGMVRRCTPDTGLPACDWHLFAFAGGILGAISLPALVLWRLRQSGSGTDHSVRE